jgi:predicted phage tail protein
VTGSAPNRAVCSKQGEQAMPLKYSELKKDTGLLANYRKFVADSVADTKILEFLETSVRGSATVVKSAYESFFASQGVNLSVGQQLANRLTSLAKLNQYEEMGQTLIDAQQELAAQLDRTSLVKFSAALEDIKKANAKNVKASANDDALNAAYASPILVIGDKDDLYAGHKSGLKKWFGQRNTHAPVLGKLTVKKGSLTSKGTLTISASLSAHKTAIGKEILEFSKKKLLDPKK